MGGSAACMRGVAKKTTAAEDSVGSTGISIVVMAPSEARHALKQPAASSTPSGQQGHGSPSGNAGIMSAQGMLAVFPLAASSVIAATTGADRKACAATSTQIRLRMRRESTRSTYAAGR